MTKKITNEELNSLKESLKAHNDLKIKLGDTVIQQQSLLAGMARLRTEFAKEENKLIEKYGKDSRINMETGEVTEIKE
ncbi:MAG: hypothetical protein Unbinned1524contig1000_34 [Prokaryotic dsDNA virus sp.]|nr:MAG: hypothetical protein Unbinned1524contig1000_34 [Prokaryotic dsDNA virus sp.]|tara:strand:- start:3297 stop:3530 length:234 start_codon:yes stop_codon:yes gene_type:complete